MTKLNPQQLAAVHTIDKPLLVLAGAGSGKTRVITEKIAYLMRQGIPAKQIVAVTFTNKAAREMKTRVAKLLSNEQRKVLRVTTFHALGFDILRREHKSLGYKATITLFDEQDKLRLLKNLLHYSSKDNDKATVAHHAQQIGAWKNTLINSEQAISLANSKQIDTALLYADYQTSLKAYNAVDFDDLLLLPVLLLSANNEIQTKWQNSIRYLLVDEYQDTNSTQYELVKLLVGKLGRFTVVGDDDQSIYAWRGAQAENLTQLQQDYPRLQVIKLEQNYRSTGRILKVANQLIANNPHKFEKRLWSALGYGEVLRVLTHKNEQEEAQQVIMEINYHRHKYGHQYKDYAVLYRGNHQARVIEQVLMQYKIPYIISGGSSFFARAEVKDILSYLRLWVNPNDDAAFLRIINTPKREIGTTTLQKLGGYANERHISLFNACMELGLTQYLSDKAIQRLRQFHAWLLASALRIKKGDCFTEITQLIRDIGYEQYLREEYKTKEAVENKWRNVLDLIAWLQGLAIDESGNKKSLAEIVATVLLLDMMERNEDEKEHNSISLMTLHAAKGLEFPHVFLIGMEEGLLPHNNSIASGTIEEERRLAYVGITRAQRSCTFSYCKQRKRYGGLIECQPSRFLDELPVQDLEWARKTPLSAEVKKERGKAQFAQMQTLLS